MTRARARALAAALLLLGSSARAADILIVQSSRLRAYEEAAQALQQALPTSPAAGPKQAAPHIYDQFVLTEPEAAGALARRLRSRPPDLVLALGTQALQATADSGAPIVYALVANPGAAARSRRNVTGVPMEVPADVALEALLRVAPRVKRIGIVHDPRRTAALAADARKAAARRGVSLTVLEARSAADVPGLLRGIGEGVDALWMLPDLTVSAPEAVDALLLFALGNRLPVLTFADKYLALGAAVAVSADPSAIGRKAADLAGRVLAGEPPGHVPPAPAERVKVSSNPAVLRNLGLAVSSAGPGGGTL